MSLDYVRQKFRLTVLGLAESTEPLQDRLSAAFINGPLLLSRVDLPEKSWQKFDELTNAMNTEPPPASGKGAAHASARKMSDHDVLGWISVILEIYVEIELELRKEE